MQKCASTIQLSKYFLILHLSVLLISVAIVFFLPISLIAKILLAVGLIIYSAWITYQQAQWKAVGHDEEGWYLQYKDKKWPLQLQGDSTVSSVAIILRFITPEKRLKQTCVIFKDAIPADIYRQLVVRIRFFSKETTMVK